MGFYLCQNTKFLIPIDTLSWFCRSTGPVDRARSRSTDSVDRLGRPTCTNVHASLAGGPVDRHGRPSRELCSLERPRSTGQRACSLYLASVDQPVDRWHNGLKYDRWPVDRAVDRTESLLSVSRPRSTGRSTGAPTVRNLTIDGRPTAVRAEKLPQQLVFLAL